ncbi:semaphorin-6D-like [Lethenteron reissneri]|uniref:semaphorin-6D-like n=1 Tax=Lethenteron reissneri TaxID=7753 RepID=UPI002AB5F1AA|nr:semaphorin-6D-like [Lethenteron reissneri]
MSRPAMRVALCVFAGVAIIASSAAATATASFPDDATPINIVDAKYTSQYPVFLGPRPKNETRRHKLSFQMMVITNSTLFIAASYTCCSYTCGSYTCGSYTCGSYTCGSYTCGSYTCGSYTCGSYTCGSYTCGSYFCF